MYKKGEHISLEGDLENTYFHGFPMDSSAFVHDLVIYLQICHFQGSKSVLYVHIHNFSNPPFYGEWFIIK